MVRSFGDVLLAILLCSACAFAQAGFCVNCLSIRVGPPTRVIGPTNDSQGVSDIPLATVSIGGLVHAYPSLNHPRHMMGVDVTNLVLFQEPSAQILTAPGAGYFDASGQWINKVETDANGVYGWYYGENGDCRTIAYMESSDGGMTFTKPNYPNNPVLTFTCNTGLSGAAPIASVQLNGFQYAYFVNSSSSAVGVAAARSTIASRGQPGTWFKWLNGSWSSPGVGGNATGITDTSQNLFHPATEFGASLFSYPNTTDITLAFTQVGVWNGFRLLFSNNQTTFTPMNEELLLWQPRNIAVVGVTCPAGKQNPDGTCSLGEDVRYPSMSNFAGEDTWTSRFYFFNVYIPPCVYLPSSSITCEFPNGSRYTVRRQVDVTLESSAQAPQVRVALTRYFSPSRKDYWETTALPTVPPAQTFDYGTPATLGYLFTKLSAGMHQLDDCYIPSWDDHAVSPTPGCGSGVALLRTLGYVWSSQQPGTVPIYRCYYWKNQVQTIADHFVSLDSGCENIRNEFGVLATNEGVIGFVPTS